MQVGRWVLKQEFLFAWFFLAGNRDFYGQKRALFSSLKLEPAKLLALNLSSLASAAVCSKKYYR